MSLSAGAGTGELRLAVDDFEYVRATPRVALARLQAEVVSPAGRLERAPSLLVVGRRAHRMRALPDPTGWLLDLGDDRWRWRVAWPVPVDLLTGSDPNFLLDLPGAMLLGLPHPTHRPLSEPAELVRFAPGGRVGLLAALLACGAIALGAQAPEARAQADAVVIQGPNGPIVLTVECPPSGTLSDGRACALPECPPEGSPSAGTPCIEAPAEPATTRSETAAPEVAPETETAGDGASAPAAEQPAEQPAETPAAAAPSPQGSSSQPVEKTGGQAVERRSAAKRRAAARRRALAERRKAAERRAEARSRKRSNRRAAGKRPAADLPSDQAFERSQREAQAHRRSVLERKRSAEAGARQVKRRHAAELRSLARRIDRAQDSPPTSGTLLPGLAMAEPPEPPGFLKPIYKAAGRKHGVPWQILASINEIETQYGRMLGPSSAGAVGWMQFMPATWKHYGVDADGDGVRDPDNPRDAIFAAARYLEASGARRDLPRAIFAYNHADWYVQAVLLRAREMRWRDPEVTKLLRMRRWQLERRVLADERIEVYGCGREDIREHRIDRRVLLVLQFLANSGLHPTVSSLDCGHSILTKSGNISHHTFGGAVDISAINGIPIMGNQGPGSITESAVRRLLTLRGIMAPDQIISLLEVNGAENTFAMDDHADHIHVGFRPRRDVQAKRERLKRRLQSKRYAEPEIRFPGMLGTDEAPRMGKRIVRRMR